MRQQRSVRGDHDDDRADVLTNSGLVLRDSGVADFAAHRNSGDRQLIAAAAVALDQYADRVRPRFARSGADAAFEPVADHSGAATDTAFRDTASSSAFERSGHVLLLYVESVGVIQKTVVGFGHYGQRKRELLALVRDLPLNVAVAHRAHTVGIGDHDRSVQEAGLFDPRRTGHFAVAVEGEPSCERRIRIGFSAWPD